MWGTSAEKSALEIQDFAKAVRAPRGSRERTLPFLLLSAFFRYPPEAAGFCAANSALELQLFESYPRFARRDLRMG
jgi:hypothetical protein